MKCNQKDEGKVYYFCFHHGLDTITETKKVRYGKKMDKVAKVTATFLAPTGNGPKVFEINNNTTSRGTGLQRSFN